jgi:RNA polymerase primary sigma factor
MMIDLITSDRPDALMELIEQQEGFNHVNDAMGHLSERQADVLRYHFGLDGEDSRTLTEIGRIIGAGGDAVSRERVRQIKQAAILKLQAITIGTLAGAS